MKWEYNPFLKPWLKVNFMKWNVWKISDSDSIEFTEVYVFEIGQVSNRFYVEKGSFSKIHIFYSSNHN